MSSLSAVFAANLVRWRSPELCAFAREDVAMSNNDLAPLTSNADSCLISPALSDVSPDEFRRARSRCPADRGWRSRALRFWLAAFFVVAGSVLPASQPNSQQSKLVGTGAVKPSPSLSADGNIAGVDRPWTLGRRGSMPAKAMSDPDDNYCCIGGRHGPPRLAAEPRPRTV